MLTQKIVSLPVEKIENNWKINRVTPHSLHNICSRICSFPPSIPHYFINTFTKKGDVVFDAWSGKGTVPLEALRNDRIGIGNDKSPEAFVLTHAKVKPINFNSLQKYVLNLKKKLPQTRITNDLTQWDRRASVFYSKKTLDQILKLKKILLEENTTEAIFVKGIILGILHGSSVNSLSLTCSHSYSMSPNYVKKYAKEHHLRRPSRDVLQCILDKGQLLLEDPLPPLKGIALQNDSTKIKLKSDSVNMILSSPPYFDLQTYSWCNWLRLWFLGYDDHRNIKKILAESGAESKYRDFMKGSIKELYRILKPGGKCFIVVGDVKRPKGNDKIVINTAEFLLPLFEDEGFVLDKIVVDMIPRTRRVMTYVGEDCGIKQERILYLNKPV